MKEIQPLDAPEQRKLLDAIKGEEYEDLIIVDLMNWSLPESGSPSLRRRLF